MYAINGINDHFHFVEGCIWQYWYICLLVCKHASETAKLIVTCYLLTLGDISVLLFFIIFELFLGAVKCLYVRNLQCPTMCFCIIYTYAMELTSRLIV